MMRFMQWISPLGLFLISFSLLAQDRFLPATLVRTSGLVQQGYISHRYDSRQVWFQTGPHRKLQAFTPATARAFRIGTEEYVSRTVRYRVGEKEEEGTFFLRVLSRGTVSLYSLTDRLNHSTFFAEKNGKLTELSTAVRDQLTAEGKQATVTDYQEKLQSLLGDQQALRSSINQATYRRTSLKALVDRYNTGNGYTTTQPQPSARRNPALVSVGVKAGMNWSMLRLEDEPQLQRAVQGRTYGAFLDIPLAGINRNISLRAEALYAQRQSIVTETGLKGIPYVDLAALLRYAPSRGLIRPYVALGVQSGASGIRPSKSSLTGLAYKLKNATSGPVAEVGVQFSRGFIALRAESLMQERRLFQQVVGVTTGFSLPTR